MEERFPDWEDLLAAAARLQGLVPEATLVGGTAAALEAAHRRSMDADHVVAGLIASFDEVLDALEAVVGRKTNRVQRPVVIKGSLDGVLTSIRNLRRAAPLDTAVLDTPAGPLRVPTRAEILRIKGWLIVDRNATRDYLDVAAISAMMSDGEILMALAPMDALYPQLSDSGAVRQQLMVQLASPTPYDLDAVELSEYKGLSPQWQNWNSVRSQCGHLAALMANAVASRRAGWTDIEG